MKQAASIKHEVIVPVFRETIGGMVCNVCNARELHAFFEVRRDFTNWIKNRIEKYKFIENQDFVIDSPNLANQSRGRGGDRRSTTYHLSLDMAKELSMVENNEKGRQARRYFIECERLASNPAMGGGLPPDVDKACKLVSLKFARQHHQQAMQLIGNARARLKAGEDVDSVADSILASMPTTKTISWEPQ